MIIDAQVKERLNFTAIGFDLLCIFLCRLSFLKMYFYCEYIRINK